MSVDKFGRYSTTNTSTNAQGLRGPKGEGFNLTKTGDYDVEFKRICNLGAPKENGDAINLDTFNSSLDRYLAFSEENICDVKGARLCNVSNPVDGSDATNKTYLLTKIPIKLVDSYSVHQFRIQDIDNPVFDGDAVNYKTFNDKALVIDKGIFNAKNAIISNVNDPKLGQDSVNLRYFYTNALVLKENNEFDANRRIITNVGFPRNRGDAINYSFFSDVLAEMSFAIFNNMKKKNKQKISKEQWMKKVTQSLYTCDWGDLFGVSENALVQLVNPVINIDPNGVALKKSE